MAKSKQPLLRKVFVKQLRGAGFTLRERLGGEVGLCFKGLHIRCLNANAEVSLKDVLQWFQEAVEEETAERVRGGIRESLGIPDEW